MKKIVTFIMAVLLVANCLCVPVFAGGVESVQSFEPIADACWDVAGGQNVWDGTGTTICTMDNNGNPNGRQAFLKFDLTGIRENLESGAVISKATVRLTLVEMQANFNNYASDPTAIGPQVSLYKFDDDSWTEDGTVTPTKLNRTFDDPQYIVSKNIDNTSLYYHQIANQATDVTFELDITGYIKSEINSGADVTSMVAGRLCQFRKDSTFHLYSREADNKDYRPLLNVEYLTKDVSLSDKEIRDGQEIKVGEIILDSPVAQNYYSSSASDNGIENAIATALAGNEEELSLLMKFDEGSSKGNIISLWGCTYNNCYSYLDVKYNDGSESVKLRATDAGAAAHNNPDGHDATQAAAARYWVGLYSGGGERSVMIEKFNISSLKNKLDNIESVQLVVPSYSTDSNYYILGLYQVDNDWSQATLTWNNLPRYYYPQETEIIEAGSVQLNATFKNTLDTSASFNSAFAVYKVGADGCKVLEAIKIIPVTALSAGATKTVKASFNLGELSEGETYIAKVMALENMTSLKPILVSEIF